MAVGLTGAPVIRTDLFKLVLWFGASMGLIGSAVIRNAFLYDNIVS